MVLDSLPRSDTILAWASPHEPQNLAPVFGRPEPYLFLESDLPNSVPLSQRERSGISFPICHASSSQSVQRLIARPRRNREEIRMYTSSSKILLRTVAAAFVAMTCFA